MGCSSEVGVNSYSEQDWDDELYALSALRADPRPCPRCGRTGFYGPRAMDHGRKLRACRFCGFWQDIDQEPLLQRPVTHDCPQWPDIARAPYVWWIPPADRWFACPFCRQRAPVEPPNAFLKGVLVRSPWENPDHPWWRVPQHRPYAFYVRFWENWAFTKGRAVL